MDRNTTVGMVGVGLMGHGIAMNICRNGYPLTLLKHSGNQPVDDLIDQGAETTEQISVLAEQAEVIILCVTGTPQVEDILYGADALLEKLRPGTTVIECSTAIPSSTEKIAEDVVTARCEFLDTPMTRTPKEAAQGRLNLIVGGDADTLKKHKRLLASFAENIFHAGPAGAGHRMKLIHNYVSLGFSTILAEAVACAKKAGTDADVVLDILSSGGGQGTVLSRLEPYIKAEDDSGFRFSLANAHKDLSYYTEMADETGSFRNTAVAVRDTLEAGKTASPDSAIPRLI